jgi:hypothetical protein
MHFSILLLVSPCRIMVFTLMSCSETPTIGVIPLSDGRD